MQRARSEIGNGEAAIGNLVHSIKHQLEQQNELRGSLNESMSNLMLQHYICSFINNRSPGHSYGCVQGHRRCAAWSRIYEIQPHPWFAGGHGSCRSAVRLLSTPQVLARAPKASQMGCREPSWDRIVDSQTSDTHQAASIRRFCDQLANPARNLKVRSPIPT